ncbi:MAG: hypothetical protein ABIO05_01685 [Ferruginibacter sp.]
MKNIKHITTNISSNVFYNKIDASALGYKNSKSIVSFSTNANATFAATKNTLLQISSNVKSARLTPRAG